ncbi:helix-turn-helix domain-containing protein [Streptomyces sp. NPDC001941]|uniref:MmyB family transcriptional regulator n=1 Tax=Streptomyces sp. NPDC001941 TaxID=3154659 RepID=UPI0033180836
MQSDVEQNPLHFSDELAVQMQASRLHAFLKGRRDHLALSQFEVAERLSISDRSYGSWERGRVREWTDDKLFALARALEMSEYQTMRLFLYAVGRTPPPQALPTRSHESDRSVAAFLDDYATVLDALSLPTFVIDASWQVRMTNRAYRELFCHVPHHPSALPTANFLRFGLLHPAAPTMLVQYREWRLAMLAQLASGLERSDSNAGLQAIRREVHAHPDLRDVYLYAMPDWLLGSGSDLIHYESATLGVRHPNPRMGLQRCRLVEETPRSLQALGLTRLTLVLLPLGEAPVGPA